MVKRNALGRGLGALMTDADGEQLRPSSIHEISLSKIEVNPNQPRTDFDEESLKELSASIKEIGIVQPITIRKIGNQRYQIIAGERRYRASKLAGLTSIPAWVRKVGDESMLEMALVENIQRQELNAIEISLSYQRLIEECKLTQEQMSDRVGKKRSTVSNYLRLLKLPALIQNAIREGKISMGHARALISIPDEKLQVKLFNQIVEEGLSVRKVEEIVRGDDDKTEATTSELGETEAKPRKPAHPEEYNALKDRLSSHFNSKVDFRMNDKGKGKITIPFTNPEDLERIIGIFDKLNS